jgi:Lrp/AsnC family transcriptional regulator, leucine-responsive regulatory protein
MYYPDNKDRKILLELDINSRQSYASIGKKLKISKEVVLYRVNKLVEEKIITNFTCIIDYSQLGIISLRTFLKLKNLEQNLLQNIIDYLKDIPQIGWVVTIIGR